MPQNVNKPGANSFNPSRHATRQLQNSKSHFEYDGRIARRIFFLRQGGSALIRSFGKKDAFPGWKELCFDRTSPGKPACSLLWLAEINTGVTKRKRTTPQGISQWRQNLHLYNLLRKRKKKTEREKQHSWGILNSRTAFEWNFDFFNAIIYRLFGKATSFIEWQKISKITDT